MTNGHLYPFRDYRRQARALESYLSAVGQALFPTNWKYRLCKWLSIPDLEPLTVYQLAMEPGRAAGIENVIEHRLQRMLAIANN
jgi:hypothetical protein